ncbi:MAG: hypothetical protein QM676_08605 [Novosphingobium sp.]
MTPPRTIIGTIVGMPLLCHAGRRRVILLALIALCALLALFPEKYRAAASLTPTDPTSLGLSGTLGQLGAGVSVFGNQAAVEVSLKVARSEYVRTLVARKMNLGQRLGQSPIEVNRWLEREVDIRALRGGIIQFEAKQRDAEFARQLVAAYGDAVREQLSIIARNQTTLKRQILVELVANASTRLAAAQTAYDGFRLQTRYSSPQAAIYAAGDRIPEMEAIIRAKQVQLAQIRQFATDDNMRVRQVIAEIAALEDQLSKAQSLSPDEKSSVGAVVRQSTQADKLRRELDLAQSLYDNYKRYLQGTSVEDLTSSANIRMLEPAYIDSDRQVNMLPIAIAIILIGLGLAIEFYIARPPIGERSVA